MGEIWRGRDLVTGQPVAIKLLHEGFASDPTEVTRFVRERTVLIGLRHPNLVPVHDMIMEGSRLALVMDFVQGPDMFRYLHAHGPLAPALAVTLISQVCEALEVVHAAGIVHRDLKPSNILLDTGNPTPVARLTDFGIAWADDALPLTSEGIIMGTPPYCAPEVITGKRGGPPSDVYAAATSLYELLVGKPPFAGGPASAVFWRQVLAEPLRTPAMPESLWMVISACLAKDPSLRPDAATTARLLRECLPALLDTPPAPPLPSDVLTFALRDPPDEGKQPAPVDPEPPLGLMPATSQNAWGSLAYTRPNPARRRRLPTTRLATPVMGLLAMTGIVALIGAWLFPRSQNTGFRFPAAPHALATPQSSATPDPRATPHSSATPRVSTATTHRPTQPPAPPASAAPIVSKVLYSFQDGTTDGWEAGANIASISAVTSFADGPGHPYGGNYALDGFSTDGADLQVPRTMMVTPATPLNLSAARTFYLYVDGYGDPGIATGYAATVTLSSGSQSLTTTTPVNANAWNLVSVPVSSWAYRDQVTGISVSYAASGSDTPWYFHFQVDDVGYTT
jgi:serine/threonine protein kinase, bacterial